MGFGSSSLRAVLLRRLLPLLWPLLLAVPAWSGCAGGRQADPPACEAGSGQCLRPDSGGLKFGCGAATGGDCDDGNPCTRDECTPDGTCTFHQLDGVPCDDQLDCTAADVCTGGKCRGQWDSSRCACKADADCLALTDTCHAGRCDPLAKTCLAEVQVGNPCDDNDPCTKNDACVADGICQGIAYSCTPGTCTQSTCDGNGGCVTEDLPAGSQCGDGPTECSDQATCDGSGNCPPNHKQPGTPCGPAPGDCEIQDTCDGKGSCTDGGFRPDTHECRSGSSPCDPPELCTGTDPGCPANQHAASGTDCGTCRSCDGAGGCAVNSTDHADCGKCRKCSNGSCVSQGTNEDFKSECTAYTCTSYIAGWSGNSCARYAAATSVNGNCNGAGGCSSLAQSCTGIGAVSASCGSAECKKACTTGAPVTSFDVPGEVCYTNYLRNGCALDYVCSNTGTCIYYGTCPYLYTWNGQRFAMETDIYGSGKLGIKGKDDYLRPVANDYYVLAHAPAPLGGALELRLVEERSEVNYLDSLALYVVDLAADRALYTELQAPSFPELALKDATHTVGLAPQAPLSAVHVNTGQSVLAALAQADGQYLVLNHDRNVGFDYQTLELDLGVAAAAPQVKLIIDGRTSFPNDARGWFRRGLFGERTRLEVLDAQGQWVRVPKTIAALAPPKEAPRPFVLDLTQAFLTSQRKVRLTFLYKTFIDHIAVDTTADEPVALKQLKLVAADLRFHGLNTRVGGELLDHFIYGATTAPIAAPFTGSYTRYGDVEPLIAKQDDQFVIFWSADEVAVRFSTPPPQPPNTRRYYLLHSFGYYKDGSVDLPQTVDPLPFAAMSKYPYPSSESYPSTPPHQQYLQSYNTRKH